VSPTRKWLQSVVDWTVVGPSYSDAPMSGGDIKMSGKGGTNGVSAGASSMKPT